MQLTAVLQTSDYVVDPRILLHNGLCTSQKFIERRSPGHPILAGPERVKGHLDDVVHDDRAEDLPPIAA